ncbi:YihY/virulence factor BrkB family protein [Mesorhizobium sp. BAC0120]|nr:YihY/virulence factor BrkB family protein [Mesorhizobium sp. BAC0120]
MTIIKHTFSKFSENRILSVSAGVTYYLLLAVFPGLAALVSLYGLFSDPATIPQQLDALAGFLPQGAMDLIRGQLQRLASHRSSALGLGFLIGLATALWSTSAGMKALFDALNVVHDEVEKRSYLKLTSMALLFTLGVIVFSLLALAGVVVVPVVLNLVGLGPLAGTLMKLLRWPLLLIIAMLALAVFYYYGPSRTHRIWRWISLGSALASLAWVAVSVLFSWYVQNFGSYDKTYGSLGAAVGFMTWLWLSTTVFLLGAQLDAVLENKSAEGKKRAASREGPVALPSSRQRPDNTGGSQ